MMNQFFFRIFLSVISLTVGTCCLAQEVRIQVSHPDKTPVHMASIIINGKHIGLTDNTGLFTYNNTSNSPFRLRVESLGMKPYEANLAADTLSNPLTISLEEGAYLENVVVTAGRRSEYISAVPSSVTILTAKDIASQSQIATNLSAILGNTVPGLATASNRATNAGQTLRGRQVLVLVDGIPQSTPLMNGQRDLRTIDPCVIERVEVVKGATSIYGNGSAGGIINYITKTARKSDPAFGGTTTLRGTIQPFDGAGTGGYRVAQNIYGHKNRWNYVASGAVEYIGVQRDGDGIVLGQTDGLSNSYQYNAFAKVGYVISDNSSITAFYNFYSSTSHAKYITQTGKYGETPAIGIRGEDPGKPAGTPFNHNAMLTFSKKNLFGNTQLDITAYMNSFRSMNRYVANATAWYGPGQTKINSRKKGVRLNLNTPIQISNRLLELSYGLDVLNDITNQDLTDGRVYIPNMNMVNIAPYAQAKLDIFQNLVFKGGVRYENARVTIKDFNTIATGPGNEGSIPVKGGKIPYNGGTFNAGLRYNKYEFFNPFISFSQGFAINELGRIVRRATDSDLDSLKTDPIITNNYEIGFSSTVGILDFTAAYFISHSKLGVELVDVGGYFMPQRLPETIRGFELTLNVSPSDVWKFGGSYAFVEGKSEAENGTKNYLNGTRIAPPKATGYLNYSPKKSINIQLFWLNTGSRNRFDKGTNGLYRGNEGEVKAVNLFNLSAAYTISKNWSLGLGIENIFNTTYYPVASQYGANNATYFRGPGTASSLNIGYKF